MSFEPIAIVGRACVLPGGLSPSDFGSAVLAGRDLIREAPPGRWRIDERKVLGAPPSFEDRAWSKRGGYVEGFDQVFEPEGFGMDPQLVRGLDPNFRWALHCGRLALNEAGGAPERAGAVFGMLSFPSAAMSRYAESIWFDRTPKPDPRNRFMSGLPALMLARALSLSKGAFALDAACASSLYAMKLACDALHARRTDMMLAGAVNCADDLFIHVGFTALSALSKTGQSRPFNRDADGLVPAEGAGFVALMRLSDALAQKKVIHGVIRGIGLSNDGRGRGLLAPSSAGQVRAIRTAYEVSGLSPSDISLVECHATGTSVGDAAELHSMREVFQGLEDVPIGSLKSNTGHLITAAGVAGLFKVLAAMEAQQRPPSLWAQPSNEALADSPFRVLTQSEDWPSDGPRRAAVSAFGFGGNNAHLLVESPPQGAGSPSVSVSADLRPSTPLAVVAMGVRLGDAQGQAGLLERLLGTQGKLRAESIPLSLDGLRFPPNDLSVSLGQQLLLLGAAQDAMDALSDYEPERTGVFIGMGADAEVARYGARWRHSGDERDAIVKVLKAPGVLGTMPNIPANRLSSQFDLGGPGFTVSAEECSGLWALELAARALHNQELDAALVGAVDLSCEPVHQAALSALRSSGAPSDAALVLVLKRLKDAEQAGDAVLAVLDEAPSFTTTNEPPSTTGADRTLEFTASPNGDARLMIERLGHPHAASGLLGAASAIALLHSGRWLNGEDYRGPERAVSLVVDAMEGQRAQLRLRAGPQVQPSPKPVSAPPRPLRFDAHLPPVPKLLLSQPQRRAPVQPVAPSTPQWMPAAPELVPVMPAATRAAPVSSPSFVAPSSPSPVLPVGTRAPSVAPPSLMESPMTRIDPSELQASPEPLAAEAAPADPVMEGLLAYQRALGQAHQAFLQQQGQVHQQFLAMRQNALMGLINAGHQGQMVSPAPSAFAPQPPAPVQAPTISRGLNSAPAPVAPVVSPAAKPKAAPTPMPKVVAKPVAKAPVNGAHKPKAPQKQPTGLQLSRAQLEVHASGKISEIYGPQFAQQDGYEVQVRMPEPPLLLADRVVGLDAEAGSMGLGTIWTETDVNEDSWYLHEGRMPPGIMIESGQADLMLISYLGVDFLNQGERAYRLLGCKLTYHDQLPKPGETLRYDIHVDGHANQGDVRLFFFHYDCKVNDQLRLTVRGGQAGFFTEEELRNSAGVLWDAAEVQPEGADRLDPPVVESIKSKFSAEEVLAFGAGKPYECFGEGYERYLTHTRPPKIQAAPLCLMGQVEALSLDGGPWGRGYLRSERPISPDDWFFEGHFKNDPCMPGTLMFDGCLQTMAFYLSALGFGLKRDGWRFEPTPGETFDLRCRGQVLPNSKRLTYEVFVIEVVAGPIPTLYADLLCTVDGLKAFHAKRVGLRMVPDWPLTTRPELLAQINESGPIAQIDGFKFGYASLLACAWGKPSDAFGKMYEVFDGTRRVARLPGPPYHFMSKVTRIDGPIGAFSPGVEIELEYDIPQGEWYFKENAQPTMPFCVLLEAALQPCGWLASFVGSALTVEEDLSFRNLDGTGKLVRELPPNAGTLRTCVKLTKISNTAGMIIESFDVECFVGDELVYTMNTVFGFFPQIALENQVGLPTTDAQRGWLTRPSEFSVDLTQRPHRYCGAAPRLPEPMLLMLDRVTGYWPKDGEAELGVLRAEKDVDPDEWFFKAHFFQDPVQPGSLGIEAMIQLLQFYMLERGMGEGMTNPVFEPIALDCPMTWKYRGQVIPENRVISTTLEVTEIGADERGSYAIAKASLWVDGKRIYEATNVGMRIREGEPTDPSDHKVHLDPEKDTWLGDHRPTFTVPTLPMMGVVDLLARGRAARSSEPVVRMRRVKVNEWLMVDRPRSFQTEVEGSKVRLMVDRAPEPGFEEIGSAEVEVGAYPPRPEPWPKAQGVLEEPLPYESGTLFHGPAYRLMTRLVMGRGESSATLELDRSGVPVGLLNPALLDAALHGIPHERLHTWSDEVAEDRVAFPALVIDLELYGPAPTEGQVRVEARLDGFVGGVEYPLFKVQIIGPEGVWAQMRLLEACFSEGKMGAVPQLPRLGYLRDHVFCEGAALSEVGEVSRLDPKEIDRLNWLPGTVKGVLGSDEPEVVLRKEHLAAGHKIHPFHLPQALPLTRTSVSITREDRLFVARDEAPDTLDISPIRSFWTGWFDHPRWPVEDLYYGLIERFVRKVVLTDPAAFESVRGRSVLFLANHQVGVESLLFSIIASALIEVPTVTLAKIEHQRTWLGKLIAHNFGYPGIKDPEVITFFDREDKSSLPAIIQRLGAQMQSPGRAVMVHVEGTRALTARHPVEKMSGAFLDMAMAVGAAVVPVRFVGGLPVDPLQTRLEFPLGMGQQDIYLGAPIEPSVLRSEPYGDRKKRVVAAINGLGPSNASEQPLPGDPAFLKRVNAWRDKTGIDEEHAALREVLAEASTPCAEVQALLSGSVLEREDLGEQRSAHRQWLVELGRRLGLLQ